MIEYNGYTLKTATLNMLIKLLEDALRNSQPLRNNVGLDITNGDIFEIDLVETNYPHAHISIENTVYQPNELVYNFKVYVMDLVNKDENNENDVLSDTLQIIGDTISFLRYDGDALFDVEYDYRISDNINCVPFTERFDNELSGFVADIRISTTFNRSACINEI